MESVFTKVFANAKILLVTEAANMLAGIATVILLARLLDVASLGLYSFSFSIGSVAAVSCLHGANNLIIRETSRFPDKLGYYLGNSLALRAGIGLVLILAVEAALLHQGYPTEKILIASLLILTRLGETLLLMFCAFFRGRQEMQYEGALRVGLNASTILVGLSALIWSKSLLLFAATQCAAAVAVNLAAYAVLVRHYGIAPWREVRLREIQGLFREGLNFSLHSILLVFYIQTNTICLYFFNGDQATGLYTAGFRFVSALGMAAVGVTAALFPAMSKMTLKENARDIGELFDRASRYLMTAAALMSLTLFVFAPEIIRLFYGERFLAAVLGLRIMAPTVFFVYANSASLSTLFSLNQEARMLQLLAVSVAFVFVINLILLPPLGYIGAGVTTLLPEVFLFILQYYSLKRLVPAVSVIPLTFKLALISAASAAACWGLSWAPLAPRAACLLGVFAAGVFALRILSFEELGLRSRPLPATEAANA